MIIKSFCVQVNKMLIELRNHVRINSANKMLAYFLIYYPTVCWHERGKKMKLKNEILEQLRIAKGKNNLSIIALAQSIGTSRYTIGSIINGRTDGLSKQTINKIDAYLAKEK